MTIMGSHPPFINDGRASAMPMPVHINVQGVAMRVFVRPSADTGGDPLRFADPELDSGQFLTSVSA